jgi:hypothetical protein
VDVLLLGEAQHLLEALLAAKPDCLTHSGRLWDRRMPHASTLALNVYAVEAILGAQDQQPPPTWVSATLPSRRARRAVPPGSRSCTFQAMILRLHQQYGDHVAGGVVSRTFMVVGSLHTPLFANAFFIKHPGASA